MTTITILIPTIGRATLKDTLASVEAQTRKADVLMVINDPNTTVTKKLKDGVNQCTTDYVASVDDDAILPPQFLEVLEKKLNESPDNFCANGSCLPLINEHSSDTEYAIAATMTSYLASYKLADRFRVTEATDKGEDIVVGIGLYRVDKLREILNGAQLSTTQDLGIFLKIREMDGNICYVPEASYWHRPRDSIKRYFWQTFRSGVGRMDIIKRHPKEFLRKPYYALPACLVAFLCISAFHQYWVGFFLYGTAILLTTSVNISKLAVRPKTILMFPLLIAITHFSYGLGFLTGIFKKEIKWK